MDVTAWRSGAMATFKALLRVPVEDGETGSEGGSGVVAARAARKSEIAALADELPYLMFDSNVEWFDEDDADLTGYLDAWLSAEQDALLRSALYSGDAISLAGVVDSLAQWLPGWKKHAAAEITAAAAAVEGGAPADGRLVGVENTYWPQDRTPGTRYYTYYDEEYLYSDSQQAPADQWKLMAERQRAATAAASPWGKSWFSTPTGQPGEYVFASSADGPWVTLAEAEAALTTTAAPSFEDLQKTAVEAARQAGLLDSISEEQWLTHIDELLRVEYDERARGTTS